MSVSEPRSYSVAIQFDDLCKNVRKDCNIFWADVLKLHNGHHVFEAASSADSLFTCFSPEYENRLNDLMLKAVKDYFKDSWFVVEWKIFDHKLKDALKFDFLSIHRCHGPYSRDRAISEADATYNSKENFS